MNLQNLEVPNSQIVAQGNAIIEATLFINVKQNSPFPASCKSFQGVDTLIV